MRTTPILLSIVTPLVLTALPLRIRQINGEEGSTVRHATTSMKASDIGGDLKATLKGTGSSVTAQRHGKADISSIVLDNSTIGGDLTVRSDTRSSKINVGEGSSLNLGSLRLRNSSVGDTRLQLRANTSAITVDKGGKATIAGATLDGSRARNIDLRSAVTVGEVHVGADGRLNIASLATEGGSYKDISRTINVNIPEGVDVAPGGELEIGIIEPE